MGVLVGLTALALCLGDASGFAAYAPAWEDPTLFRTLYERGRSVDGVKFFPVDEARNLPHDSKALNASLPTGLYGLRTILLRSPPEEKKCFADEGIWLANGTAGFLIRGLLRPVEDVEVVRLFYSLAEEVAPMTEGELRNFSSQFVASRRNPTTFIEPRSDEDAQYCRDLDEFQLEMGKRFPLDAFLTDFRRAPLQDHRESWQTGWEPQIQQGPWLLHFDTAAVWYSKETGSRRDFVEVSALGRAKFYTYDTGAPLTDSEAARRMQSFFQSEGLPMPPLPVEFKHTTLV